MPPPRYCFGLLFSDLIDRLLFKTHQKFKMALGECSELCKGELQVSQEKTTQSGIEPEIF